MKIKGETLIQLTNIKTGEVEEVKHTNFVTEFAQELFRECGALNTDPLAYIDNTYPLDDLFGGVMLFDKKINQNVDDTGNHPSPIYCPAGVKMVANGSISFSSNSNASELGQYNSGESNIKTNVQRKYVYDWDSNEGNGKINCVCLTSRIGGYIGAGNATSGVRDTTGITNTPARLFHYSGTGVGNRTFSTAQFARLAGLDLSQGQVAMLANTAANSITAGSVTINWYDLPVSKLQPFISKIAFDESVLTAKRTQTITFTNHSVSYGRVMGGMGYILLLGSTSSSVQNNSTVYAVQLNKDGTVTEKTFTVHASGTDMPYSVPLNDTNYICGKIIGNNLYLSYGVTTGSGDQRVYRIKGDGSVVNLSETGNGERVFLVNEGRVYINSRAYYDTQTEEVYVNNATWWHAYSSMFYRFGLWQCYDSPLVFVPLNVANTTTGVALSPLSVLRPPCNWLSTINNLSQEIEKTPEKTMKVTYILTLSQS